MVFGNNNNPNQIELQKQQQQQVPNSDNVFFPDPQSLPKANLLAKSQINFNQIDRQISPILARKLFPTSSSESTTPVFNSHINQNNLANKQNYNIFENQEYLEQENQNTASVASYIKKFEKNFNFSVAVRYSKLA